MSRRPRLDRAIATKQLGPHTGTLRVKTYREGVAQKIGHDLVLEVERWEATVEVGSGDSIEAVELNADPNSLQVREWHNGVKPLSGKEREDIRSSIAAKVLRGKPIAFASTAVEPRGDGVRIRGELTIADTTRPAAFDVDVSANGQVAGTLQVTQSEWHIKPYKALMGALKVRDTVEVVLDVRLSDAAAQ